MKKLLIICVGLLASASFADTSDTSNVQVRSLSVIERLGDIERIDVTAEVGIVEDGYNDEEVMRILEQGEALEVTHQKQDAETVD